MRKFITQIFQDENKRFSSNRFVGILSAIVLCVTLFISVFSKRSNEPSSVLVECITALSFGALGLGAANKIFSRKDNTKKDDEPA
jgi:xanthine/uracil permease